MNDIGASIIARLKAKAQKDGLQLQLLLNLFCQEEFLRRIQKSKYRENLVLKGGFLIYAISKFEGRPTMDADYMLRNYSNATEDIKQMANEIIDIKSDREFIKFEIRGTEQIAEHRKYNGTRLNLIGFIKNTKTPFSIDIGVGDIVVPPPSKRLLPVLLPEFEKPKVLSYSLESIIAEKFDAIIARMELTGRMKDFYDIYYLVSSFDFDGRQVQEAIMKTLQNRGTFHEKDTLKQIENLVNNKDILIRWESFCKKTIHAKLEFKPVVELIIKFIQPLYEAILNEKEYFESWKAKYRKYII